MQAFGRRARGGPARVYFTGGATALLYGWRRTTIDLDMKLDPDRDDLLRSIPQLKEEFEINVELAAPSDFIPELPGWRERSPFIAREGDLFFHHFDPYSQALAKIERGHSRDVEDVRQLHARGLIEIDRLEELFRAIEPELYRFPAIDPGAFRRATEATVASLRQGRT